MRKIITFTVTTLLMASAFGASEIYRWRGPDGTWHYSDQPRPGAELVRGAQRLRPSTEPQAESATPDTSSAPTAINIEPMPVSDAVASEVRAAAASAKEEQCKQAEQTYQLALQARRIVKVDEQGKRLTDAQGNPVFMNDNEMDAERLRARANRDLACGPGA